MQDRVWRSAGEPRNPGRVGSRRQSFLGEHATFDDENSCRLLHSPRSCWRLPFLASQKAAGVRVLDLVFASDSISGPAVQAAGDSPGESADERVFSDARISAEEHCARRGRRRDRLHAAGVWHKSRGHRDGHQHASQRLSSSRSKSPARNVDHQHTLSAIKETVETVDCDLETLKVKLTEMPPTTTDARGRRPGDPVNLVIIGDFSSVIGVFALALGSNRNHHARLLLANRQGLSARFGLSL